jgi:hypothetical protein
MECSRCLIEYDNGEIVIPDGMAIDEAVTAGVAFCVMCIVPQGDKPPF